jgi:glycosyltransferase involved in cell wall biosynthesis
MRLAVVTSHPIQYNAPWFRFIARHAIPDLRVFYLWNGGVSSTFDHGFGRDVRWDIPLLDGYQYEMVDNRSRNPGTRSPSGLHNPKLSRRLAAFHPDAILFFGYHYRTCYQFLVSRRRPRVPLLFRGDSHRLAGDHRAFPGLRRAWTRAVFREFSAFLFVGAANRAYFKSHGVPDDHLFRAPHAVDNERFWADPEAAGREASRMKAEYGINPTSRVILFAGKFESKKRPADLIAAFRRLELPRTTLVFVGSGELENSLRAHAGDRRDIVFIPFQNQAAMPGVYMLGDVFVLPSYGPGESWGLAVNEAMCMSRPVIVSTHVGCAQDLVEPGRNGLVFEAGDVEDLTRALREAMADANRLENWGRHSRAIVERYSYAEATSGLLSALRAICPQPGR